MTRLTLPAQLAGGKLPLATPSGPDLDEEADVGTWLS